MIRPTTLVCALLAFGSGLYLYQSKHRAQLLDREIGRVVGDTRAARERITVLTAEWQNLNEQERLKALAQQYLPIRTLLPPQTVPLAELGQHLPAPLPPGASAPPAEELVPALVASAPPPSAAPAAVPVSRPAARPVPVAALVVAAAVVQAAPPVLPRPLPESPHAVARPSVAAAPALVVGPAIAAPIGSAAPLVSRPALVQRVSAPPAAAYVAPASFAPGPVGVQPASATSVAFPAAPSPVVSSLGIAARGSLLPPPVPMH